MVVDVLPRWERYTYWIVGVSGMAFSVYALFLHGDKNAEAMARELSPGWSWLGRYQDRSDKELRLWKSSPTVKVLATLAHVLVSQICFYCKVRPQLHAYTMITVDLCSAYMLLGGRPLAALVCSAILMYLVSLLRKPWLVWAFAVVLLHHLNVNSVNLFWINFSQITTHLEYYQYIIIAGFLNIRLVSFGLEKVKYRTPQANGTPANGTPANGTPANGTPANGTPANGTPANGTPANQEELSKATAEYSSGQNHSEGTSGTDRKNKPMKQNDESSDLAKGHETGQADTDPSFSDLLLYAFYWPTFHFGPILVYKDFHNEIQHAFSSQNVCPDTCDILKQITRIAFWVVFVEFQAHFLYHKALSRNPALLEQAPYSAVAGIGYWHAQYFMIKYVAFYGSAIEISRFDGITTMTRPRCLSWVYTFADIWKYFDVGLYNFTKTHIYIPLGGSRAGLCKQLLASGLAFTFIIFWHSLSLNTTILFMGNYIVNCLQVLASVVDRSDLGNSLKSQIGPAMYLRIQAVLTAACYITCGLIMGNFFFGDHIGRIMSERLATKAAWTDVILFFAITTACVHNGMYIKERYFQCHLERGHTTTRSKQKSS